MFCISLLVLFRLVIVLSVLLRFTDSDWPFWYLQTLISHWVNLRFSYRRYLVFFWSMIESRFGKVLLVITLKWAILEDLMNQFICYLYSMIASSSQTARGGTIQNLAICRLFVVPTNISIEFGKDCNCIKRNQKCVL